MSVSAATGVLNITTAAAGNVVSVTGLSFTPTILITGWSGRTAAGSARGTMMRGLGVAVSASSFWAIAARSTDANASAVTASAHTQAGCIVSLDASDAIDGAADLQSFDAAGFTLEIVDAFPADYLIHYLAIGGDAEGRAGRFTAAGTAPVTQAVTVDTGFVPTGVLLADGAIAADPPGTAVDSRMSIGAMAGATQEGLWIGGSNDTATTMVTAAYCLSGEAQGQFAAAVNNVNNRAEFSSFDADGFTINWLERALATRIYYLAIRGCNVIVGNLVTQTDTVTAITETGFGFIPAAAMVVSAGRAASTADTLSAHDMLSVGFATSASDRNAFATHDENGVADSEVTTADTTTAVYQRIDTTDAVVGLMDVQSFDADGITFIMDDADAVGSFAWYIAVGPPPTVGGSPWYDYAQLMSA